MTGYKWVAVSGLLLAAFFFSVAMVIPISSSRLAWVVGFVWGIAVSANINLLRR